ncbi:MAG: cytochrome c biogenesis protein ResB [Pseudomonadota bacterium]
MRKGSNEVRYLEADSRYATILSVGRAPYAWLVFLGFTLMIVGTVAGLLYSHRRYWVQIQRAADGTCTVLFAGSAKKHRQGFRAEYDRLVEELRAQLGSKAGAKT